MLDGVDLRRMMHELEVPWADKLLSQLSQKHQMSKNILKRRVRACDQVRGHEINAHR